MPLQNWGQLPKINPPIIISPSYPNIYQEFTKQKIWPRGFPVDLVAVNQKHKKTDGNLKVAIWQGLVNGDADVDAIYRLTINSME